MKKAGLDCGKMKGYGFKGDSKNANTVANGDFKCEHCGANITSQEASYSKANYQKELCRKCQGLAKKGELNENTGNEQQNQGEQAKQN